MRVFANLYRLRVDREEQIRTMAVVNQTLVKTLAERDQAEQERAKLATEVKVLSGMLPIQAISCPLLPGRTSSRCPRWSCWW